MQASPHESGLPNTNTPALWLESLPEDIQLRIAKYVTKKKSGLDGLNLAKASTTQARLVSQALDYTLQGTFASHAHGLVEDWVKVFQDVRVLQLHAHPPNFALLSSPKLRVVFMNDDPFQLDALSKGAITLERLELTIRYNTPAHIVCQALANVSFKGLRLCECKGTAFFKNVDPAELANSCASVESLIFECTSDTHARLEFIKALPLLRELLISCASTDTLSEMIQVMKRLQRVSISEWDSFPRELCESISEIPTQIKELHFGRIDSLGEEEIAAFRSLVDHMPHLEKLFMVLRQGIERFFPRIPSLRELDLMWDDNIEEYDETDLRCKPTEGSIARIIDGLPRLTALGLRFVRLSDDEIVVIIKGLGERLQKFGLSVDGQDVGQLERLLTVIKSLTRYAKSLKQLCVHPHVCEDPVPWRAKQELLLYLDRLHRQVPDVDILHIEPTILNWPEKSENELAEEVEQRSLFHNILFRRDCCLGMTCFGDAKYVTRLADFLATGFEGLKQDRDAAVELYKQAVALGDTAVAIIKLWMLTENDNDPSLEPSPGGALELILDMDRRRVKSLPYFAMVFYQGTSDIRPHNPGALRLLELCIEKGFMYDCLSKLAHLLDPFSEGEVPKNPRRAVELYKRAIEEFDDPLSLCNISKILIGGYASEPPDKAGAIVFLERCARTGCKECMNLLASVVKDGYDGKPSDPEAAVRLLESLVIRGDRKSVFDLAEIYYEGYDGHPPDLEKAIELFDRAIVEQRHPIAQRYRALIYQEGFDDKSPNLKCAVQLYEQAIRVGDMRSCVSLANILEEGYDQVPPNPKAAIRLYEKAIAGGDKNVRARASSSYATLLLTGCGELMPDPVRAARLFQGAIDEGYCVSMQHFSNLMRDGCGALQVNMDKASKSLPRGIDEIEDMKAKQKLARIVEDACEDVGQDHVSAAELYRLTIAAGTGSSFLLLEDVLKDGFGRVLADVEQVVELYKKGVEADDPWAMYSLALILEQGLGREGPDPLGAVELYNRAIDRHNCGKAMRYLGYMLRDGYLGVLPNWKKAMAMFTRGAVVQDSWSKLWTARLTENGYGDVKPDAESARRIYVELIGESHSPRIRAFSMWRLARIAESTGDEDPEQIAEAADWCRKAIELDKRQPVLFKLAALNGDDSESLDLTEVVRLLRKAVARNYGPAFFELANIVENGYDDVGADSAEAERLFDEGTAIMWSSLYMDN